MLGVCVSTDSMTLQLLRTVRPTARARRGPAIRTLPAVRLHPPPAPKAKQKSIFTAYSTMRGELRHRPAGAAPLASSHATRSLPDADRHPDLGAALVRAVEREEARAGDDGDGADVEEGDGGRAGDLFEEDDPEKAREDERCLEDGVRDRVRQ